MYGTYSHKTLQQKYSALKKVRNIESILEQNTQFLHALQPLLLSLVCTIKFSSSAAYQNM